MDTTNDIKETVGGLADTMRARTSQLKNTAMEQSRHVREMADFYAHEHTWKTIGVVALAAVAIGWLLGSSRRS